MIVIGSGPGGEKGAAQAAYFGKSVALIERAAVLGGAAANTGTLPSKTLRETALHLTGFHNRDLQSLDVRLRHRVNAREFLRRAHQVSENERRRVARNLQAHRVETVHGGATFLDANTIEVTHQDVSTSRLTGEVVLIATADGGNGRPVHSDLLQLSDAFGNL